MNYCFAICGTDFVADVDYRVTYKGCRAQMPSLASAGRPAEAPEFEITRVVLCKDVSHDSLEYQQPVETPKWLQELIENSDELSDLIVDEIREGAGCVS